MLQGKQCKQCGRYLPDDCFDKYPSRSTGQRNTTTGRRRVCRDCFNFNQRVDRAYKAKLSDAATPSQLELLAKTEVFFKSQIDKGFEPMGVFARSIKGQAEQKRRRELTFDDYMESLGISNGADPFVEELQLVLAKAQVDGYVDDEVWDDLCERYDKDNDKHKELMNAIENIQDEHDEYERAKFAGSTLDRAAE